MVNEVRIYVEGGGNRNDTKTLIRQGFSEFFRDLVSIARERRIDWRIIACGSRENTFRAFEIALKANSNAFNVLLVDAEKAVSQPPWQHLAQYDHWIRPDDATDEQCHLMVQCMEAWFVADSAALRDYYGQGFRQNALPRTRNIEAIDKVQLTTQLARATKNSEKKGEYHKIRHGTELLARINSAVVRAASMHCERLFAILTSKMTEAE